MPAQIASRDDMTLAQKQRLAVLAKMGVGPVASPVERSSRQLNHAVDRIEGPPPVDRRAVLLERERRMREQEERQREEEERREAELAKKKEKKNFSGLSRLGPVMPREEDIPQFLPAPAKEPSPPRRYQEGGESRMDDTGDDDEEEAVHHPSSASGAGARRIVQSEELRQRLGTGTKKKKKKRVREDGAGEDWQGDDDLEEEEETVPEAIQARKQTREGGISKQSMVVESVKGKVSHANKNLTDADLERRFQLHDHQRDTGSLMTEEEVLRLIRKERKEKQPNFGSAARRVQRELAEWETAKEVQRARVKSPHRFERMVVARK